MKSDKSYTAWYFLLGVVLLYIIVALIKWDLMVPSLKFALNILKNIIWVFVIIFIIMVLINFFITPQTVSRYLGKSSGIKKWIIAVVGGIISTGPIYMWYPMLKELKNKGVNYGLISTFLYNRAVKIPLLPILIFYFGITYTLALTIVMIFVSVIQGLIFEKIEEGNLI